MISMEHREKSQQRANNGQEPSSTLERGGHHGVRLHWGRKMGRDMEQDLALILRPPLQIANDTDVQEMERVSISSLCRLLCHGVTNTTRDNKLSNKSPGAPRILLHHLLAITHALIVPVVAET
jgi:hypothetical protein